MSADNPADHSSRGLDPTELRLCTQWWEGPSWMKRDLEIPEFNVQVDHIDSIDSVSKEAKTVLTLLPAEEQYLIQCLTRMSSWKKIVHVTAFLMGIGKLRRFQLQLPPAIRAAELRIINMIQDIAYPGLLEALQDNFKSPHTRKYRYLKGLAIFLAEDGLFRVGGRLARSNLPSHIKHPALVPATHPIVRALILHTHQAMAHGGKMVVHNHLRQMYWIPNATKTIKSVLDKCLLCHRYHAKATTQLMGQLPPARVNATRPFLHTSTDFFGPYELRNFTGRGGRFKVWVALFTCMATRAIHLEIVSSLSSQGFLLAFRRFIARRGRPAHMYSDNGTNFVGADSHLQDVLKQADTAARKVTTSKLFESILPDLSLEEIKWHFNSPAAPAQGGVWEACVKLVKTHLRKFTEDEGFTWEQFESLLTFIEAIVNSRPLTPLSEDPHDLEALTPAHFLVGGSPSMVIDDDLSDLKLNRLDRYQLVIRRQQDLWRRWQTEYVTALQKRTKWQKLEPNLIPGSMVLIIDDQAPPLRWRVGRISDVHPGKDELVRVATVETDGTYKDLKGQLVKVSKQVVRPIAKLARIPLDEDEQDPRFAALPYPNKEPAVTTIAQPYRLKHVSPWQFLYAILTIMQTQFRNTDAVNTSQAAVSEDANHMIYFPIREQWLSLTMASCLLIFSVLGILGNVLTIVAIKRSPILMKNHIHWLILSLCCSDLLFSRTSIPLAVSRLYYRQWIFSEGLCHVSVFLLFGNLVCTLANIVAITLNRYVKIVHNQWYHRLYTNESVTWYMIAVWVGSFIIFLPTFTGLWGRYGRKPSDPSRCTILPDASGFTPKPFLWILGNVLPVGILLYCYIHMIVFVHRTRRLVRKLSDPSSTDLTQDYNLTRMVLFIIGSYLLVFEPVLLFNWIDSSHTRLPMSMHYTSAVMAWSTSWINLVTYVTTNKDYRSAYLQLFRVRQARYGQRPSRKWTTVFLMAILASAAAVHEKFPDLSKKAPPCDYPYESHHHISRCYQSVQWLHILNNGTACSRTITCRDNMMVSSDAKECITPPLSAPCNAWSSKNLDRLECQTKTDDTYAEYLDHPPFKSNLCTVSELLLKHCDNFTEKIKTVPIAMIGTKVYPLDGLHITQHADPKDLSAYSCKGKCPDIHTCYEGYCNGDELFCNTFPCQKKDDNSINQYHANCFCTFNRKSITHFIPTEKGEIAPTCWGSMRVLVRKSTHIPIPSEYPCIKCTIECTERGLRINTPGQVSRYIGVRKNPGHVAVTPTTTTTDVQLQKNMLASTGPITVEMWFTDFDDPSIRKITCPRIPVCKLIQCHVCMERWLNVSCYDVYHWVILASVGFLIAITVSLCLCVVRSVRWFSWYLTYPLRCLIRCIQQRRNHRSATFTTSTRNDDEESGIPLTSMSSTPYAALTRSSRRARRLLPLVVLSIVTALLGSTEACSNYAMLSAATTECDYSNAAQKTCNVRINTRLGISPIGQTSCLRLDDARSATLGTVSLETQSISLRCEKELLYFAPRPQAKCDSSRQCFNVLPGHECTYQSCVNFGVNDTIAEFHHDTDKLGWSACYSKLPGCFYPLTGDCLFVRTSLVNPTNQAYSVFNCPQWTYAVRLKVQFHMGTNLTTETVTLYAGKIATLHQVNFTLISASVPPIPALGDCILSNGNAMALTACNIRGEGVTGRIGEIQCNTMADAENVSNLCFGDINLINTQVNDDRVRCTSNLIDPERVLLNNPLPLKLQGGILIPSEQSVSYEATASSLLDIQITTDNLQVIQEVEQVECDVKFIKLEGCYSCLGGAVLSIQSQTNGGNTTATIECPSLGFFTPVHLTAELKTSHIVMKTDQPDINAACTLTCGTSKALLQINGHLHYLQNTDMRHLQSILTLDPDNSPFAGFSLLSLYGPDFFTWVKRGIIMLGIILLAYVIIMTSLTNNSEKVSLIICIYDALIAVWDE